MRAEAPSPLALLPLSPGSWRAARWALTLLISVALLVGLMRDSLGAISAGTPSGNTSTGTASLSWSHTVSSGSNRVLVVRVVNINTSVNITTVKLGATSLTQLANVVSAASTASGVRASVWYLVAPAAGTQTVTVTLSGSTRVGAGSQEYTGVAQSTPFGPVATSNGSTTTSSSVAVATGSGDSVIDLLAMQGVSGASLASGGGQSGYNSSTGGSSSDVLGAASMKAAAGTTSMSWTTSASTPWAHIGVAMKPAGAVITGTVFEDMNYGGGAGRSLASSSGTGASGATVELYSSAGAYIGNTTTDSNGLYTFGGLAASTAYHVRVVSSTVPTNRSCNNSCNGLLPVLTYRTNASSGSAVAVTDFVGGTNPALADPGGASSATFNTSTYVYSAGLSGTAHAVSPVTTGTGTSTVANVDFGFSFSVVSNVNDSGQGSLRQWIVNANELIAVGTSLAQVGGTAQLDNAAFMISNGSSAAGLRSGNNLFSGGVATINLNSALPTIVGNVIDARRQPGWTNKPIVVLNGSNAGNSRGMRLSGLVTVAGFVVRNFASDGIYTTGGSNVVKGSYVGVDASGAAAAGNGGYGVRVASGSGDQIGGTGTYDGNVIAGNGSSGVGISGSNSLVQGNLIGLNAAGTAKIPNGGDGVTLIQATGVTVGGTSSAARNVISGQDAGQYSDGIWLDRGGSHTIQGNWIGLNAAGSATIGNAHSGMNVMGSSNNVIGGTAAGEANVFAGNTGAGVYVSPAVNGNVTTNATGNRISGNSFYSNGALGIDIDEDGVTANNGSKTTASGNSGMDFPVIGSASLSGSTLTVSGYVGSASGQSTFGSAVVEFFIADVNTAGNGEGKTYLGTLTANASGVFSGSLTGVAGITGGTTRITATARDASNNTSEFGANVVVAAVIGISGTVFEDANYGGGAGRSLAASSGVGTPGAVVELYNGSGVFVSSTSCDSNGAYAFSGLNASTNYFVRVVSASVRSQRDNSISSPLAVLTYRTTGSSGSAVAVTDFVGGTNPALADPGAVASSATFNTSTFVYSAGLSGPAQNVAPVSVGTGSVTGVDFGFNFDTVVNTNNAGQGSLRQAITNAQALPGDGTLAQPGRTAGVENIVFMISNGSTGGGGSLALSGGLRSANNYFSGGVASIAPSSALPEVTGLVIDAQAQPGWTAAPIVELNGAGAGANTAGLTARGGTTLRGLVVNRYTGAGVQFLDAGPNTLQGSYVGVNAAGTAASANGGVGVNIYNAPNAVLGGTGTSQGNVISGNTGIGLNITGTSAGAQLQGNTIGLNAAGTARVANGSIGLYLAGGAATVGGSTAAARNVIAGNTFENVQIGSAAGSSTFRGNYVGTTAAGAVGITNGSDGLWINGASNVSVGGTAAGMGNVIAGNNGRGVLITGAGSGNAVQGNSIFGNGNIGIDLANNGISANDGAKTAGQPNQLMDYPVFSALSLSGTTLTLSGYVGSAAGQSTFASARVEIFISDETSANGQGKTYLGFLTTDASGNFSGSLTGVTGVTNGTTKLTATATDGSGNTSEFGPNMATGLGLSGVVFEDRNYGGGAGRNRATAAGTGVNNARVELYDSTGTFVSATATDSSGAYAFTGLASGNAYFVRVVNSTVVSGRSATAGTPLAVMSYRTETPTSAVNAVTNEVGGLNPAKVDAAAGSNGSTLWTDCAAENATCSFSGSRTVRYGATYNGSSGWTTRVLTGGTSCSNGVFGDPISGAPKRCYLLNADYQSIATVMLASGSAASVDFGFSFDTVVNTNDSGQGSLRQAINNANILGDDSTLVQAGRAAAIENLVFMISNGTSAAGLRSTLNYFNTSAGSYNVATIAPASALPVVSFPLVIDAQTQPGWTLNPLIELRGDGVGSNPAFALNASNSVLRGFVINRVGSDAVYSAGGSGLVIQGNWIGLNAAGTAASANTGAGIWINSTATGLQIGGTTAAQRNVISGSTGDGLALFGGSGHSVQGNYIGTDAAGTVAVPNGRYGIYLYAGVQNSSIGGTAVNTGNLISGNTAQGVAVATGATGNAILRNSIYGNGVLGIDLGINGLSANDGAKTAGQANLLMDSPVFTSASLSGTTLSVTGYVGSAAGQTAFAGARVEVFISDAAQANGQGRTWLGFLTADANGNFSGDITGVAGVTNGSTRITGTATDGSNNTSEFGANLMVGMTLSGTVFEDVNYGGGAGRSRSSSAGVGLANVTVELYDASGAYVRAVSTNGAGLYSFVGVGNGNYLLRVVNGSVVSQRSGTQSTLRGVLTYRTNASTGTAVDVTDWVGGTNPALVDPGAGATNTTLNTSTYVFGAGLSGTAHAVTPLTSNNASISNLDFGFSFNTVVNTNASGQGSLAQAITNANALDNTGLAQAGRTAGTEHIVFMIGNGTAAAGLRSGFNYFSGGVATITPATGLPSVNNPLVIDAQTQPGWTANPIVELNGSAAGNNNGFALNASGSIVRGFIINRFGYSGIDAKASATIQGNWIGVSAGGNAASANGSHGVLISGSNVQVGGSSASGRNVLSGNAGAGIWINSATSGHTILGNYVGLGADGSTRVGNTGFYGIEVYGSGVTIGGSVAGTGNVISGQSGSAKGGVWACASNLVLQGNFIGLNAAGTAAVPNAGHGVAVCSGTTGVQLGGSSAGQGNVIGGNAGWGVTLDAPAVVQGNTVGMNAAGSAAVANGAGGVVALGNASGAAIGGTASGAGNLVSGNGGAGVAVLAGATGVSVLRNLVYGNSGVEIDLGNNGITANDGIKTNGQANLLMDSPVFSTARASGNQLALTGYVGSAAGQATFASARVDVFISDNDASGSGGGKTWLGTLTTDGSGNFSGTVTMPLASVPLGTRLTGTATDGSGNTSEFGVNFNNLVVDFVVNSTLDTVDANIGDGDCLTAGGVCTLRAAIAELNAWSSLSATPRILFALPGCSSYGAAACQINVATQLPTLGRSMDIDGTSQAGWTSGASSCAPIVVLNGSTAASTASGLVLGSGTHGVRGLVINGFGQNGVLASSGSNHLITCNWIGLNAAGTAALANGGAGSATGGVYIANATGVVVGGSTAADRNVISGNGGAGVWTNGGSSFLYGNYIGTNAAGDAAIGNGRWGVQQSAGTHVIGGALAGQGNVIAGHTAGSTGGVLLGSSGQTVQGNAIGTNAARSAFLPNGDGSSVYASGIDVRGGTGHLIGGSAAGQANLIAGNQGMGVRVTAGATAQISANSIYANQALGIDLGADGVSTNDGAINNSQANKGMDMPVITGAGVGTGSLTVYGYIGTGSGQPAFAGARVEFFKAAPDASGYGEGQVYLGTLTADADGRFSGNLAIDPNALAVGDPVTATATSPTGETSEFGPNWTTTTVAALTPGSFNAFDTDAAANALSWVIRSRIAGTAANIAVIALDNSGTALHPGFTGTVSLTWVDARDDSGATSGSCRASWVNLSAVGSAGSAVFNNNARVTVSVTPPATSTRVMRLRMSYTDGSGTKTACSNDAFAALPASFSWLGASDADSATAGTTRTLDNVSSSGGVVHRAGRPFTVRMQALTSTGAVMTGYTGTPVLTAPGCLLPSGCTAATLTAANTSAVAGLYTHNTVSYAEVGAIQLRLTDSTWADIDTADTAVGVRTLTSSLLSVGRFVPDSYTVTLTTTGQLATANAACMAPGSGATFMGQGFGWSTVPQITITAKNAAGVTTANWTAALMKLLPAGVTETLAASNTGSASLSSSYGTFTLQDLGSGQVLASASTLDRFMLDLAGAQDSVTPSFSWSATVNDPSEAAVAGNPTLGGAVSPGAVGFNSGGVFHSGRLTLSPGYGDVRSGVRLLAQIQRYTAAGWVTLTEDTGCVTVQPQNVGVESPSGVFGTVGVCAAPMQSAVTTRGGRAWLSLPGTPAGAPGRLTLRLAGQAATGNSCTPAGASAALVPLNLPWLTGGGSGPGPSAWATWGSPQRDAVLRRETW